MCRPMLNNLYSMGLRIVYTHLKMMAHSYLHMLYILMDLMNILYIIFGYNLHMYPRTHHSHYYMLNNSQVHYMLYIVLPHMTSHMIHYLPRIQPSMMYMLMKLLGMLGILHQSIIDMYPNLHENVVDILYMLFLPHYKSHNLITKLNIIYIKLMMPKHM